MALAGVLALALGAGAADDALRVSELAVPPGGRAGFTRLAPERTGVGFSNVLSDARAAENQIRLNGSGVAAGDVDGDGRCDLYFCGLENANVLYRNLGDWRFADITAEAGVACPGQYSTGCVLADVDGDGDLDLLVGSLGGGVRLFLNDGHGRFTESADSGLVRQRTVTTMALADVDGDGDLDLYVANYRSTTVRSTGMEFLRVGNQRQLKPEDREDYEITPEGRLLEHGEPDFLYLNDGRGHFAPVSWTDGHFLDAEGKALASPPRDWGLTAQFRDFNRDGAPDLYVCNDFHTPDRLWLNDGRGGFRAAPPHTLRHLSAFSMVVDVADIDRDGYDDLFVSDMLSREHGHRLMQIAGSDPNVPVIGRLGDQPQYPWNMVQWNRGDATFAEIAFYAGLEASEWTWSAMFLDVDLDGYEDLLCNTGHVFDTQDLDADQRIRALGPMPRQKVASKILLYPHLPCPKLAFRNRGDLTFEEVGARWGFDWVGVSHGMVMADLDNDGDLDAIVNNLNAPAGLFRNESSAPRLAVRLRGAGGNTQGIGARIEVRGGPVPQSQEVIAGGRYLSGAEPLRVFAAGSATNRLAVDVAWRSGRRTRVSDARPNWLCELTEPAAETPAPFAPPTASPPLFTDASQRLGHVHHETPFDDYARQPLLPWKLSQLGPGVCWHDLDQDGWDDLAVGTGKGGTLGAFRNDGHGGFTPMTNAAFARPITRDQTTVLAFERPQGAPVILAGSANYEDGLPLGAAARLYDLGAQALRDPLPGQASSTGPMALADYDGDGVLDLLVGGRVVPGRYPEPASSLCFLGKDGEFQADAANSAVFAGLGLVAGAVFTDLDGDGWPELALACEWGPLRLYRNREGRFVPWDPPVTLGAETQPLSAFTGWWSGLGAGDFDGDGRIDLVAANGGLNSGAQASFARPRRLYYADLDGRGMVDLVEACTDPATGLEVPDRDLVSMAAGRPILRERFPTFAAYGKATVADILARPPAQVPHVQVTTLATMLFLNRGHRFEARPLPREAQFAPAFAVCVADFDGDGHEDVYLSQNLFAVQPLAARADAGRGLLLLGDGRGAFAALPGQQSGIRIYGEQRGAAVADYDADGRPDLAVAQNGAATQLLHNDQGRPGLRVRLRGPAGNPTAVGAQMRLQFAGGPGPVRELHAGSGYWSQDSAVQVLATPETAASLWVRWPGGQVTTAAIPPEAREIEVSQDGSLRRVR